MSSHHLKKQEYQGNRPQLVSATTPRVSVLMPVRNAIKTLSSALRSLSRQSFEDFEIIVVDDGSQDGCAALLARWRQREPRLQVIERPNNGPVEPSPKDSADGNSAAGNLVAALNLGLAGCRGEFVARMDADDAMLPRRLERQVDYLDQRPSIDVVGCHVRCFPRRQIRGGFLLYENWLNSLTEPDEHQRQRFVESPVAHPSVMVRRRVLERVGGYRDQGWAEDYDLWLRLFEAGCNFAKVSEVLLLWRDHATRQTRVSERYSKRNFLACKAHFLARGPLRDALGQQRPVIMWGAGPTGKALAKALRSEGALIQHFVDIDPKKLRRRPGGVGVLPVTALPSLIADSPSSVVVVAVASRGARQLIQAQLEALQQVEGRDYWLAS